MNLLRTSLILTVALSSAACGIDTLKDLFTSPTEPTTNGEVRSYLGTWAGPTLASGRAKLRQSDVENYIAVGCSGERRFFCDVRR